MLRTSQCFRTEFPKLDGPPTLAAAEAIPYALICPILPINLDRGVYPLDFSRRHKWHFPVLSILTACIKARHSICPMLQGFAKKLFEPTCDLRFRPHSQRPKWAAPAVIAK